MSEATSQLNDINLVTLWHRTLFELRHGHHAAAAVLPMQENLEAINLKLTKEELQEVSYLPFQQRYFSGKGMGWGDDRPWKTYR